MYIFIHLCLYTERVSEKKEKEEKEGRREIYFKELTHVTMVG